MTSPQQRKFTTRKQLRHCRKALSPGERKYAQRRIQRTALNGVHRYAAHRVACYLAADGEVDTAPLITALHQRGVEVYLPCIVGGTRRLRFRRFTPTTPLRRNPFGIPEPAPSCATTLPINRLDVVFTPLVGFTRDGHRLGMGGGFYDTTFALRARTGVRRPRRIGLAFACQQLAELPTAEWDVPLHGIITEHGWQRALPSALVR